MRASSAEGVVVVAGEMHLNKQPFNLQTVALMNIKRKRKLYSKLGY